MNKLLPAGLLLLTGLGACNSNARKVDVPMVEADSIELASTFESDSLLDLYEENSPVGVDILFEDFMYLFSTDYEFQRQRIKFPILSSSYKADPVEVTKEEWKHDSLLMGLNYYTLLFDRESDADAPNDSSKTQAQVEWYDVHTREVKVYSFQKEKKGWQLEKIDLFSLNDSPERDFVDFYEKFVKDTVYQEQHIKSPLTFVTIDPDDDFAVLTTTLDRTQWFAFRPVLPSRILSKTKVMAIKGNGNGISYTLCFRRKHNAEWVLYKYEDISI